MVVLGLLWLVALVISALSGHHGLDGSGNTDLQFVIAGLFITIVIMIPNYNAQEPCNQVKIALRKLADAENEYFTGHKTFTTGLNLLNFEQNPQVDIMILRGNEQSFSAAGSHMSCDKNKDGTSAVFMWDSTKGGLQ